ncbi:phosphonate C-P lyase system protein PhnG [Almyronema epifaneia]|uniref:Phosphonate C-P lyase system protein PhnG n=1 Tax=Almyronema epifaneia S1 TaxID=2991925 RepID=A0ABW6ILY8_9CYAN
MMKSAPPPARQAWIATLAKAPLDLLEQQVNSLGNLPDYRFLRSPEIGLAMVRGRTGGTGSPFNLGEMTLTRCVVQLAADNTLLTGFGYVAGRSPRHAELAAVCDALLQHPDWQTPVQRQILHPLEQAAQQKRATEAAQAESTRVNFFTLVRGEG